MQTALFKAARSWQRIQGDPEPYVRRILYTQNVSWWRSRRHVREQALGAYDVPAAAADPDLRLTLEQALGRLTTRQRTVLVLRYFEDLTEVQTADVLGIGSGTVKSIGRQALARLRVLAPERTGRRTDGIGPTPTGVRIVDLLTGRQRSVQLTGGQGVDVRQFLWSPDSRWVLWDGNNTRRWDDRAYSAGEDAAGRIAPGATSSQRVPQHGQESTTFAVGDDGTVLIVTEDDQTWWDDEVVETEPRTRGWGPEVLTRADGVLLEARKRNPAPNEFFIDHRLVTSSGSVAAPALAQTELWPLGVLDDGTLVAQSQLVDETTTHLSLVDLADGGTLRKVGEIEGQGQVTVAIDLMTTENPTVRRTRPSWLDTDEGHSATTPLLTGAGALLLVRRRL